MLKENKVKMIQKLDNSLSTLVVDGKTIDLIPGKTDYEVTVRNINK